MIVTLIQAVMDIASFPNIPHLDLFRYNVYITFKENVLFVVFHFKLH
jgi:hypothetical protein